MAPWTAVSAAALLLLTAEAQKRSRSEGRREKPAQTCSRNTVRVNDVSGTYWIRPGQNHGLCLRPANVRISTGSFCCYVCLTQNPGLTAVPHSNTSTANSSSAASRPGSTPSTSAPPTPKPPPPVPALLTVNWTSVCGGDVLLHHPTLNFTVCFVSDKKLLTNVCNYMRGCKGPPQWKKGRESNCSTITMTGAVQRDHSTTLRVQCKVEAIPDVKGQLHTYKVMTALLCCVLVIILLIRFSKPTVKALQKRLSNRTQNRWVGPTQSHSVSYQRGKTVTTNDGEKRLSYPALERLMVSDSREPSSNRNSGYNF